MSSMEVAQALTRHYVDNGNVAAVVVAGSVGRGRADAHSDLELDVYWHRPPTDEERLAPIRAAEGQVRQFWAYEPVDAEWSEELTADGVEVTVSGFTASWLEACIEQVTVDGDADVTKQMRLSAINEGTGVHGQDLIERWRLRSTRYPRNLAVAVAASYLTAEQLGAWRQWRALYARGDLLALRAACGQAAHVILGALCAVNGVLIEHPSFKWLTHLLERLITSPPSFSTRLMAALDADAASSARALARLLDETVHVVRTEIPEVNLSDVSIALDEVR
jgi:hypothetical protein